MCRVKGAGKSLYFKVYFALNKNCSKNQTWGGKEEVAGARKLRILEVPNLQH